MAYYWGFVTPVAQANQNIYIEHARKAWPMFKRLGATRMVETWGANVPDGKQTDFKRAVDAKPDEAVLFSWIEWPDRATADAAETKMHDAPEMAAMGDLPFDATRMIYGGFMTVLDTDAKGELGV